MTTVLYKEFLKSVFLILAIGYIFYVKFYWVLL